MKKVRVGKFQVYYNEEKYLELAKNFEKITFIKSLKDNQRSRVEVLKFKGEKLVFKEPREKNRRKWQRFLSIFRGSESLREFKQGERILKNGFKTCKGILVIEEKKFGVVVNSYFFCEFLEGREGSIKDLELIKKELDKIHGKGFLHGDSQLVNFIIDDRHKKKVYLIDAKLSYNKYGGFGRSYEYIYLEESSPREIDYRKEGIYYQGAKFLNKFLHLKGNLKNKLKGRK